MIVVSDPLKYLVTFDYRNNNLVSICRHNNYNMINYF